MTKLGISHFSAYETDPIDFVALAADAGCEEISVFVQRINPKALFPLVTPETSPALLQQLKATGLRIANVECFVLYPDTDIEHFRPALECGAALGARSATVLIFDTDEARVIEKLTRLCELTATLNMRVGVEFLAMTPKWNTLQDVTQLVTKVAQPNLGLGIDLLHVVRSGGTAHDVAAIPPALIGYVQLCDGADLSVSTDYAAEAGGNRLAPGDGQFPLQEFLKALPAGTHLELEVPQPATVPAQQRVKHMVEATRRQMQLAGL